MTDVQLKQEFAAGSAAAHRIFLYGVRSAVLLLLLGCLGSGWAQSVSFVPRIEETTGSLRIATDAGVLNVEMIASNMLRVSVQPAGKPSPRTLVIDPDFNASPYA